MSTPEIKEKIVRDILSVAGGELNITKGEELLNPNVVMHMAGLSMKGWHNWRKFIRFINVKREKLKIGMICHYTEVTGDKVLFHGQWKDREDNLLLPAIEATFRIQGKEIVEIWSKPSNYAALFGKNITTKWGFKLFVLKVYLWNKFNN